MAVSGNGPIVARRYPPCIGLHACHTFQPGRPRKLLCVLGLGSWRESFRVGIELGKITQLSSSLNKLFLKSTTSPHHIRIGPCVHAARIMICPGLGPYPDDGAPPPPSMSGHDAPRKFLLFAASIAVSIAASGCRFAASNRACYCTAAKQNRGA